MDVYRDMYWKKVSLSIRLFTELFINIVQAISERRVCDHSVQISVSSVPGLCACQVGVIQLDKSSTVLEIASLFLSAAVCFLCRHSKVLSVMIIFGISRCMLQIRKINVMLFKMGYTIGA